MADTNESSVDAYVYQNVVKGELNWIAFIRMSVLIVVTLFAVYVNCVILYVLNSKPVFKESSRYILFAHMLFNDTVHLILTFFLFFFAVIFLKLAKAVCSMILFFDSTTFYIAPLNLAVMSLERYVAICFPLRHTEIATQKRTGIAIIFIWLIGCVNILMNIITATVLDPNFFSVSMFCAYEQLYLKLWQPEVISWLNAFLFVSVTLIIVFTYISIMITARSVGTSLYLHVQYVIFLLQLILPRCLSPLIYGLRDDAIRPLFKHYFCPCLLTLVTSWVSTIL
uniref:G-protein coupled receptors family 1 profile domain-containing protein n=1 Tax=Astyanax mexicanus TaxID=7994 RepID=A0A3B1KJU6_ASTMX